MKLSTESLHLRIALIVHTEEPLPAVRIWFFGVILPIAAIVFQLVTRIGGELGIDPLPTHWHTALVFLVPGVNLWLLAGKRKYAGFLTGAAMGVSIVYSLLLLPFTPLAAIGLIVLLGAVGFAPYTSLYVSFLARKRLRLTVWPGLVAVLAIYCTLEGQRSLTNYGLGLAVSTTDADRARGLSILRNFGQIGAIQNACEGRHRGVPDLFGAAINLSYPVSALEARKIWYQLNGKPYEARNNSPWWDANQGSATVGTVLPDVTLAASRIDGSVDAQAALSYVEWTLEFQNSSTMQREARAELPAIPQPSILNRPNI